MSWLTASPNHTPLSLDSLNANQRAAVLHPEGPVLVLAGAGSGKTRVVIQRIAHLLERGLAHHQIIALTFTNKAAGEMRERLLNSVSLAPWVGTFHSFGLRVLREWAPMLGLDANFVIYDPDDSEKLMKQILQESGLKIAPAVLASCISSCKSRALNPNDVVEMPVTENESLELSQFIDLYARYERGMRSCSSVDFDDLLFLSVRLFREHPQVLEELQRRWCHLLVDEYQDTNSCQYEMIRLLSGQHREIFVVGDPDQSIYSWRGADIQNILNFERDFPGATIIRLEDNYRSSPQILRAASELIANNEMRYEKKLRSTQSDGKPVTLYSARDDRGEAQFVAYETERLLSNGYSPSDIAIFYRTNFQSRAIEDSLRRVCLPYRISGGVSFYQRKEIKDILAYLRVVLFDYDRIAIERALGAPKRGLGEKSFHKLFSAAEAKSISPLELMAIPQELQQAGLAPKARAALAQFHELIQQCRISLEGQSVSECLTQIIQQSRYMTYLSEQEDQATERMENVNELIAKAMEWEQQREENGDPLETPGTPSETGSAPSLRAFLEEMNLGPQEAIKEGDSAIMLMTVHNAKGLEFPVVFIIGLEEMLFPHINHKNNEGQLEEERRLLYVGMTRARKQLYLCCAQSRFLWGASRSMRPSRFIHELPMEELLIRGSDLYY